MLFRDKFGEYYRIASGIIKEVQKPAMIKKVGFYDPVTVVFWEDGTKTVVKAGNEAFDKEKGLAMAIAKKYFGNTGSYQNVFKQWIKED